MTRIGFVTVTSGTGGMERYLLRLLGYLPAGVEAVVFVRSGVPGELHEAFAATGAKMVYGQLGYLHPLRMHAFYRMLRSERLDAFVDLTGVFSGFSLALARLAGIPLRTGFHRRSTFAFQPSRLRMLFARLSIRLLEWNATAILANSKAALEKFHPALLGRDRRLAVFANIIPQEDLAPAVTRKDMRAALKIPESAKIALHVGRVDPAKDHPTLLRALGEAMRQDERLFAVLAGPGTEVLAQKYPHLLPTDLAARFRLLGNRTDIAELNHAADLFVFTSVTEGQPNALLEAMICGLPVIASDIAPIREVIPERGWPLLVVPGDPNGFVQAILACLGDARQAALRCYAAETRNLVSPDAILPRLFATILPAARTVTPAGARDLRR